MAEAAHPPITVLMAVHNGAPFVRAAVESILRQTFRSFSFLVVDDASKDETCRILRSFQDPRVELLCLPQNMGQTAALNSGVRHARSPWIARMDADDYSAPNRLEEQMKALERHPHVQCVGTAVWEFSEDPRVVEQIVRRPLEEAQIRRAALLGQGIIHGSVLIGRQALLDAGGYNERYRYASDRELFIRFLRKYRAINLKEPLLGIRRHPEQDSYSLQAADEYIDIFLRLLAEGDYSPADRRILRDGLAYSYLFRGDWLLSHRRYGAWLTDLVRSIGTCPSRPVRTLGGRIVRSLARKRQCN